MISLGFSYLIAGRRLELSTKAIATEDLDDRSRRFLMHGGTCEVGELVSVCFFCVGGFSACACFEGCSCTSCSRKLK